MAELSVRLEVSGAANGKPVRYAFTGSGLLAWRCSWPDDAGSQPQLTVSLLQ